MKKCSIGFTSAGVFRLLPALLFILTLFLCLTGCGRSTKETPRISLAEGVTLPAVTALAWLDGEAASGAGCFVSVTEDGAVRVWDAFSGRVIPAPNGRELELPPLSETENPLSAPEPGGTRNLSLSDDGGILLSDAGGGKELARYYAAGNEWISISTEGFFNASSRGSFLLAAGKKARRYSLSRLSGALFRPDLFKVLLLGEKVEPPVTLESLFEDDNLPPLVSLSSEGEEKFKITVTGEKGGVGLLALYRREGEEDVPAGLFDIEKAAGEKYEAQGKICFDLTLNIETGGIGGSAFSVSAFNKDNTVESERLRLSGTETPGFIPVPASSAAEPVLRVLLAAGDESRENTETLGKALSLQKDGTLYSAVEIKTLLGGGFSRESFFTALAGLRAAAKANDTFILHLRGALQTDSFGDLRIVAERSPESSAAAGNSAVPVRGSPPETVIAGKDLLEYILGLDANSILLLDLESRGPAEKAETALLRFRQRLGPKALLASFGTPGKSSFANSITEALGQGLSGPEAAGQRYISAGEFFSRGEEALAGQGTRFFAFPPAKDFRIADRFINTGELIFQTMASGTLKIDRVDKEPVPLIFGENPRRILPPGSYIIDMVYRNGYRETRTVELRKKDSTWVIFTYTPPLLVGDFSARLPSFGINTSELNPVNYQKINREAMEGMGMAPYYVAFLAGEKFYKDGNYERAIAEYSRAISLKADYADAFASRGNAQRRKGDLAKALEDYDRALNLKNGYAEVYNYRGYVYAQEGNQSRAIADYTQAIRYRANYADAYFNRAYSYSEQGNWDRAIADYTQVIKLEPSNAVAYNQRAKAYNGKGETSKAAADYAAAERLGSDR